MADSESSLLIRVSGNIEDFNSKFDEAKAKTEAFGESVKKIGEIAAVAFAALSAEIGFSIKSFGDAESTARSLNLAIQNQGLNVGELSAKYKEQADQLSVLTGIDDDRISKGQAILQGLIGQVAITDDMTKAALDLSTQTGDLNSAFDILGRGIQGNVRQLKQFGIEVDAGLTKTERMRQIVEKLEQKFGDQAAAANKGVGSVKGLGVAFEDFQKAIGSEFAPLFTLVVQKLTEFINKLRENEGLVQFTAGLLAAGVALTGIVAVSAAAVTGFLALSAAASALGVSVAFATGGLSLLAVALVALGVAAAKFAGGNLEAKTETEQLEEKVESLRKKVEQTKETIAKGGLGTEVLKSQLPGLESQLESLEKRLERLQQISLKKENAEDPSDKGKRDAANKAAAESDRLEKLQIERRRANLALEVLITEQHTTELVELKKKEIELLGKLETEKNANMRDQLEIQLRETRELQKDANQNDATQRAEFDSEILKNNKEFQALDDADKKIFIQKNKAELTSQLLTEKTARQQAAKDRAAIQIKANNQYLLDQQKFGTAYALINKAMHSAIFTGSKQAFGDLEQLQSSSSATLKSIGKTAAIANVVIATAESAMRIFDGFSTIPIVGPALGIAGAAAAVAFGAERVSTINAAAQGGVFEGGIPGEDSILSLVHPGELAVPKRNFEETVNAVAAQRNANDGGSTAAGPGGEVNHTIELSLKGDLGDLVEKTIVERRRLGRALI